MTQDEFNSRVLVFIKKHLCRTNIIASFDNAKDPYVIELRDRERFFENIITALDNYDLLSGTLTDDQILYTLELGICAGRSCGRCTDWKPRTRYLTPGLPLPVALPATNVAYSSFDANWQLYTNSVGFYLDVALDSSFNIFVPGYNNLDVGNVLTYPVVGLDDNTTYYYRIRVYTVDDVSGNSNTINATTVTIYTACAVNHPSFVNPLVPAMFLTADELQLAVGTLGDYVISWRLNSIIGAEVFRSGITADPSEIQAQHPFVDEVVFAGTLYPTIEYIYIDGIRYTSNFIPGIRYSPDLAGCLDPVVITEVTCGTILGTDPLYTYNLVYNNALDLGANKSRKIKFVLSPTTELFAWEFRAYDVAEQIIISYCTLADPDGVIIDNFVHGSQSGPGIQLIVNLNPENYPNNPRITHQNYAGFSPSLAFVTRLDAFTYAPGNYLKIEIIGSVYEPMVSNTNWYVKFKCLTYADLQVNTFICDTGMSKINSVPAVSYESDPTCMYRLTYNTVDQPFTSLPARTDPLATGLYKYLSGFYYWYGPTGSNPAGNRYDNPVTLGMRWSANAQASHRFNNVGWGTYMNLAPGQTITITKDTTYLHITCTDVNDYNKIVDDIALFHADPDYIAWQSLTDADYGYYAIIYYYFRISDSIGDAYTMDYFYFWWGAPITYDPINLVVTFEMLVPVNALVNIPCDNAYEIADNWISTLNSTKNRVLPVGGINSHVRQIGSIYAVQIGVQTYHEVTKIFGLGIYIHNVMLNGLADMAALGFCSNLLPGSWVIVKYYDRFTFTDPTDHASRLANWRLERMIGCRTDVCADYVTWETVYETP